MDTLKPVLSERKSGPDILRTIAVCLVFVTHSLAYLINFQDSIGSLKWNICVFLHFLSITCVPLFLLLTGYLCKDKKLSARYFLGIVPVLVSYFIIAVFTAFATNYGGLTDYNFIGGLRSILDFTAIDYAWYVEMYIGLFMLIPFLNILWRGLEDKNKRVILILVLCLMTTTVQFFKSFRPFGVTLDIVPDYWESIYPVTYYFLGAFIAEYKPKINKGIMLCITCFASLLPYVICVFMSNPQDGYAWFVMNGFSCLTTAFTAVCIFLTFYDINLSKFPSAVFKEISVCSFEMYLWSYCVDLWLYGNFRFSMPLMLVCVFFITYALSRSIRLCLFPVNSYIKNKK